MSYKNRVLDLGWKEILNTQTSALFIGHYDTLTKETIAKLWQLPQQLECHPPIYIYGKECKLNRSVGMFSNEVDGYRYSGQISKSSPLTPELKEIMDDINNKLQESYNGVLVNYYKDGSESIGRHSDDETGLGKSGVVAISLGATRTFRIRRKLSATSRESDGLVVADIPLSDQTVVWMAGKFQQEFSHEIPVEKKVSGKRLSLTFRMHRQQNTTKSPNE